MSNKLISFLLAVALGALVMYLLMNRNIVPPVQDVIEGRYRIMKQSQYDSLTGLIQSIQVRRHADSLRTAAILQDNTKEITASKEYVKVITFKDYTDPELDSLVDLLCGADSTAGDTFDEAFQ